MRFRLIILLACSQLVASAQTRKDTALSFFPHAIGDFWIYSHAAAYMNPGHMYFIRVEVLQRVTMPNGHEYALFETTNQSSNARDTAYRRIDSSTAVIWQYNSSTNSEFAEDSLLSTAYSWFPGYVVEVPTLIRSYSVPYLAQRWGSGAGLVSTWWDELGFPYIDTLVFASVGGKFFGNINAVDRHNEIPSVFQVSNPYPNPFNPRTNIRVSIQRRTWIQVTVADQLGRIVGLVADREFEAGEVILEWDAGQQASGFYYIRIASSGTVQTLQVVLIK